MAYRFFRSPRTMQERRESQVDEAKVRASRNWRNLPTSYDDINRTIQRTWKAFRKTKWRSK